MKVLTEKFSYGFIVFTIFFGVLETVDKLVYHISSFNNFDIIGIGITTILSAFLLFWELNRAVISNYPSFVRLQDLGSYYGIPSKFIENGTPLEDDLKIMIKRRGRFKNLVRPRQLIVRMRPQYEVIFAEGGSIILTEEINDPIVENGFKLWSFKFDESSIEENTLGYSFKIHYPKDSASPLSYDMTIPNCDIILNYGFGFWKKCLINARETIEIRHG